MRTTITTYYDATHAQRHSIVCHVEESGAHTVIQSSITGNLPHETPEQVWDATARLVGIENTRLYMVEEFKPSLDMYIKIEEHEKRFPRKQ